MFNSGEQPWRMQVNPTMQHLNNPIPVEDMQDTGRQQEADFLKVTVELEDLKEAGMKIKHHEEIIKCLESRKKKLDELIVNKQAAIESYNKERAFMNTMEGEPAHLKNEDKTIENALRLKKQAESMFSDAAFAKSEVIGVVATLGRVGDENLSRLLSNYLGVETMLAIVCKSNEGLKTLSDQFTVICLEDLSPYVGESNDDYPQRRLAIQKPRFVNGEIPAGFLDFAVNMINIDQDELHYYSHNLRETLFYRLFSTLQVYRSREDMFRALPCMTNGAISLDGGVVRSAGVYTLGHNRQDIEVKFPICSKWLNLDVGYVESSKELKKAKWKRDKVIQGMEIEKKLLHTAQLSFEKKKRDYLQCQSQDQAGRETTSN